MANINWQTYTGWTFKASEQIWRFSPHVPLEIYREYLSNEYGL